MSVNYKTPGVYLKEIFLRPETPLQTGVAAFVGFAGSAREGEPLPAHPVELHRKEEFAARFKTPPKGYLAEAVKGFFSNGGTRCYVSAADPSATDGEGALTVAVDALASVSNLDLVVVPDAMTLCSATQPSEADIKKVLYVQRHAVVHCATHNDRLAVLDALPVRTTETVLAQREALATGLAEPLNAALYYPWVQVYDADWQARMPDTMGMRHVPPGGHVAGIYARTDAHAGVFKAPANEEVLGAIDLETALDFRQQERLNPEGVNCLRAFAGRGIRVWGARTLSRLPEWRYVNVRRQLLTVNRWLAINMAWANFEPNVPRLWVRITRELSAYLESLWRAGGLRGATPAEAFYVKCDEETNPPEVREEGEVVTEVGLALAVPSEFVVVRIFHRVATTIIR
jgi:uncharacterized protein